MQPEEKRNEQAIFRAAKHSGTFGLVGQDHTPNLLKDYENRQKEWQYSAFKNKQRRYNQLMNYKMERGRLRSHVETHRLPALHGVISRLADLDRILQEHEDVA